MGKFLALALHLYVESDFLIVRAEGRCHVITTTATEAPGHHRIPWTRSVTRAEGYQKQPQKPHIHFEAISTNQEGFAVLHMGRKSVLSTKTIF